jgi:hypothetical protein
MAAVTVPAPVLSVVTFASPGYPDSWQRWWGTTQGDSRPDTSALATGATAGAPGAWTPAGATPPPTVAKLVAKDPIDVKASPATAWAQGQYVQTATAGAPGQAHWSGSAWVAGPKP